MQIFMHTHINHNDAMVAGMDAGADDYITKSADFEVLKARVRAQLRRKQFEDENRRIREQLLNNEIEATEARAAKELAETRAELLADLKVKNQELESFSYSVSHDLRAPLRSIDGFSQALMEDHADQLSHEALEKLQRVRTASQRMSQLIDDLLKLSRLTRSEMHRTNFDLSAVAKSVAQNLQDADPQRRVDVTIASDVKVHADEGLMRIVLENLLGNAWKFTSKIENPRVEFGTRVNEGATVYFVRDNGAGFDMAYKEKLFGAFQRLHGPKDFPGTGIGLATVNRIVSRHGGHITADAAIGKGATFSFTLD
jgi:two-component system NtrC family sensor kinase